MCLYSNKQSNPIKSLNECIVFSDNNNNNNPHRYLNG